jgi:hypothetical protein
MTCRVCFLRGAGPLCRHRDHALFLFPSGSWNDAVATGAQPNVSRQDIRWKAVPVGSLRRLLVDGFIERAGTKFLYSGWLEGGLPQIVQRIGRIWFGSRGFGLDSGRFVASVTSLLASHSTTIEHVGSQATCVLLIQRTDSRFAMVSRRVRGIGSDSLFSSTSVEGWGGFVPVLRFRRGTRWRSCLRQDGQAWSFGHRLLTGHTLESSKSP